VDLVKEKELVQNAVQGDQEAFGTLVRRYSNAVYGIAYSMLGDFHLAQDVAQESFIKAWYKLDRLKEAEKFPAWVIAIARRTCIDRLRKEMPKHQSLDEAEEIPAPITLEEQYRLKRTQDAVRQAIQSLDEKYRVSALLYHIGGYNAREISRFLDIQVSVVESRLRRAKQKLKKELFELVQEFLENNRLEESFEKKVTSHLKSLFHIQIPVKNLDEAINWYSNNLGFKLREHYGKCAFLSLPTGPLLMLWQTSDETTANFTVDGNTMPVLLYATDDIHSMHDSLKGSSVQITHFQNDGFGWVMKFYDPNGNMWGVIQENKS
jgi:RNA polymerase sigma factor (sigma-70 family)